MDEIGTEVVGRMNSIPFPTRDASSRLQPRPRRLRVPMLILGLLLVLGCGLGFGVVLTQVGRQQQVLVLADSVAVGHVLTASDLRLATVSQGTSGIDFIGAAEQSSVIGRPVAVAVPAGAPLVSSDLGNPMPAQGEAVVAVLVKPGQAPPSLAPGASVWIVMTRRQRQRILRPQAPRLRPLSLRWMRWSPRSTPRRTR